ncbi:hypothetical protein PABG_05075 [Paracoccidioides brasiliensis Pb03]|nr:hypothetical protein PABG_05075 [Paracoccidioides brasiliensis Pb03]
MVAWRMMYKAFQFRNSTAGHLLNLAQSISVFDEAHFRALLFDAWDEWSSVTEFSLQFSAEEVVEIEKDVEGDDEGIKVMNIAKEKLEDLWPEKGISYEALMTELKEVKVHTMWRYLKSDEDQRGI